MNLAPFHARRAALQAVIGNGVAVIPTAWSTSRFARSSAFIPPEGDVNRISPATST